MQRYFIEVAYKGTNYAGFQIQQNANTIQREVEQSLNIYYRKKIDLTGSSRTDAGVHAFQNFFHFDTDVEIIENKALYHINAILPNDIVVKNIKKVYPNAHCRFDAISRHYQYKIYQSKNPFLDGDAYYYPFHLNEHLLNQAASIILANKNFQSFSKKNTQVNNFLCSISKSEWIVTNNLAMYSIVGNRFLRGMVRNLVGIMLNIGTEKLSLAQLKNIIERSSISNDNFSVPAQGLYLFEVKYGSTIFKS